MNWDPKEDGVTHVNVYSKGKTELGRLLSNFAHTPFVVNGLEFASVEAYWYWIATDGDTELRGLHGWKAKYEGKNRVLHRGGVAKHVSVDALRQAYAAKLKAHPEIQQKLLECKLPFAHYYMWDKKLHVPKEFQWTAALWEEFR